MFDVSNNLTYRGIDLYFKRRGGGGGAGVISFKGGKTYFLPKGISIKEVDKSVYCKCYRLKDEEWVTMFATTFMFESSFKTALSKSIDATMRVDSELSFRSKTKTKEYPIPESDIGVLKDGFDSIKSLLDWLGSRVDVNNIFSNKQIELLKGY